MAGEILLKPEDIWLSLRSEHSEVSWLSMIAIDDLLCFLFDFFYRLITFRQCKTYWVFALAGMTPKPRRVRRILNYLLWLWSFRSYLAKWSWSCEELDLCFGTVPKYLFGRAHWDTLSVWTIVGWLLSLEGYCVLSSCDKNDTFCMVCLPLLSWGDISNLIPLKLPSSITLSTSMVDMLRSCR